MTTRVRRCARRRSERAFARPGQNRAAICRRARRERGAVLGIAERGRARRAHARRFLQPHGASGTIQTANAHYYASGGYYARHYAAPALAGGGGRPRLDARLARRHGLIRCGRRRSRDRADGRRVRHDQRCRSRCRSASGATPAAVVRPSVAGARPVWEQARARRNLPRRRESRRRSE